MSFLNTFKIQQTNITRNIPTFMAVIAMICLTIYMFYPGIMNVDSADQLQQARAFEFTDWHPPIMSFLWFLLNHFSDGAQSMFIFHNLVFWAALALLSFFIFPISNLYRVLFIVVFGLFPTILVQLGTVFKDSSMSISLFLTTVLFLYAERKRGQTHKAGSDLILWIAIIFLFYGFAVRLNAAPAVAVLCVWFGNIVVRKSFFKGAAIGLLLFCVLVVVNQIITAGFLKPIKTYPFQQIQIHDLAAISLEEKKPIFPKYILDYPSFKIERVKKSYTPLNVGELIFDHDSVIRLSNNKTNIKNLNKVWLSAIYQHPWSYLKHRAKVFTCVVYGCVAFWSDICRVSLTDLSYKPNCIYNSYCGLTLNGPLSFLFHSWVYIINGVVIGVIAIRKRRQLADFKGIIYLITSGLLYVAGSFFYAPACEFRYVYWLVIASSMALVLLIKNIFQTGSRRLPG